MTSGVLQLFVILLFLVLGVLLYLYAERSGIRTPERSDELFPMIATGGYFPAAVGVLFVIGLVSSAYSAAGSALTALTTSFTVDILRCTERCDEARTARVRKRVHAGMAATMGAVILVFGLLNDTSVINAVYTLASYTYGPILGLFAFGIFTRRSVRNRWIPLVAVLSPVLCYVLQRNSERWFGGYSFSYELLIFNALFTFVGLCLLIVPGRRGETGRALPDTESGQSARTEYSAYGKQPSGRQRPPACARRAAGHDRRRHDSREQSRQLGGGIRSFAACVVERADADRSGLSAVHVHHGRFDLSVAAQVRLRVQRRGRTQDTGPHGGDFRRRSGRRLVLALLLLDAVACRAGRSAVGARGALGERLIGCAYWAYCSGWRSATEREP